MAEGGNNLQEQNRLEQDLVKQDNFVDKKVDRLKKILGPEQVDKDLQEAIKDIPEDKFDAFMNQYEQSKDTKGFDNTIMKQKLTEYFQIASENVVLGGELILGEFIDRLPLGNVDGKNNQSVERKIKERIDNVSVESKKIYLIEKLNSASPQLQQKFVNDPQFADFAKQKTEQIPNLKAQLETAGVTLDTYLKLAFGVEKNSFTPEENTQLKNTLGKDPQEFLKDFNQEFGIVAPLSVERSGALTSQTIDADAFAKQAPDRLFDGVVTKSNDANRKEGGFDNVFTAFEKDFYTPNSGLNTYLDKNIADNLGQSWVWGTGSSNTLQPGFESLTAEHCIDIKTISPDQLRNLLQGQVPAYNLDNIVKQYMTYFKEFDSYTPDKQATIRKILDAVVQRRFLKETQLVMKKLVAETYFAQVADLLAVGGQVMSIKNTPDAITYNTAGPGSMSIDFVTDRGAKGKVIIMPDGTVKVTDYFAQRGNTDTHDNPNVLQQRERTLTGKLQSMDSMISAIKQQSSRMSDMWTKNAMGAKNSIDTQSYNTALYTAKKDILQTTQTDVQTNKEWLATSLNHSLHTTKAFDATVAYLQPLTQGNDAISQYFTGKKSFVDKGGSDKELVKPMLALRNTFMIVPSQQIEQYTSVMKNLTNKVPASKDRQKDPYKIVSYAMDAQNKTVDINVLSALGQEISTTSSESLKDMDAWISKNALLMNRINKKEKERIEQKFENADAILQELG